jgi:hypothetical protein
VSDIISITVAHLHPGYPGEENPPVITLYSGLASGDFDPDNPVSGDASLSDQDLLDLLSGRLYVNVHTEAYPDGEIRGQVGSGLHAFEAQLSGANEAPPVETGASGRAVTVLDDGLSTLYYRVAVSDIISVTAAHIHAGIPGENGPVVFPLFDGTGDFSPGNPISGTLPISITQVAALVAGNYYVNVHTEANPDGEIRGQLGLFKPLTGFHADLSGAEEVPPVDTEATGDGEFDLNEEMDMLHYLLSVQDIADISAAHIHRGPPGVNGPVVFPLYGGTGDFGPDDPISGDLMLGPQDLLDLLTGFLYANVHTTAYPDGEIRGQIEAEQAVYLPLMLNNGSLE